MDIVNFIGSGWKDMLGKSEDYYINKCSSANKISSVSTKYGYENMYVVEDKLVTLTYQQYANGEDDYDDELVDVKIENKYPALFISEKEESLK